MKFPRFTIERSVEVAASARELYDFHQYPGNMRHILPPGMELSEYRAPEIAIKGAEFCLHFKMGGRFPLRWKGRWAAAEPDQRLIDESMESPFRLFIHEHIFNELTPERTRMTDRVTYALPLPWLSWPVAMTIARWQLGKMFQGRHARTVDYFSNVSR